MYVCVTDTCICIFFFLHPQDIIHPCSCFHPPLQLQFLEFLLLYFFIVFFLEVNLWILLAAPAHVYAFFFGGGSYPLDTIIRPIIPYKGYYVFGQLPSGYDHPPSAHVFVFFLFFWAVTLWIRSSALGSCF